MIDKSEKGIINWRIASVVLLIIFVMNLVCSIIYADSPFLIESYFPNIDPTRIGHYAGYLVSMYNMGQIPGSLFWGWAADKYGRKIPLIIVLLLDGVLMTAFGLTHHFSFAITFRCLWGIGDGYLGISKTILSEVCSQDMLPVTTGLIFVATAVSSLLGPILGGYLSDPDILFHSLVERIPYLKKVPFAIPLSICGFLCFLCALFVILWVDESLPLEKRQEQEKLDEGMKKAMSGILRKRDRGDSLTADEHVMMEMKENNYWAMFRDRMIVLSVLLYAVEALIQTTYDTLLPVWLASSKSVGGFSFDKKDVSWIVSFVSPLQMATLLLFPVVCKAWKATTAVLILSSIQLVVLGITPVVAVLNNLCLRDIVILLFSVISSFHIVRSIMFKYPFCELMDLEYITTFLYSYLCIVIYYSPIITYSDNQFTVSFTVIAQYVLIANSCYQEFRAKAYCLSQVLAGLFRFIGPTVIPMLYSWSIAKHRPFPFNYGLSMYVLALLTLLCIFMTIGLPTEINGAKGSLYDVVEQRMENRRKEKERIAAEKRAAEQAQISMQDDMNAPLLEQQQ